MLSCVLAAARRSKLCPSRTNARISPAVSQYISDTAAVSPRRIRKKETRLYRIAAEVPSAISVSVEGCMETASRNPHTKIPRDTASTGNSMTIWMSAYHKGKASAETGAGSPRKRPVPV
ncbi:unknown [Clostridium sp. CAG:1024]|nr:unknown [Clostridium sp. CAG:1024]